MSVQEVAYTLAEYQARAIETAEPRAFHLEYLVPGIVGEIGELFGQHAKAYWHEKTPAALEVELISEYGDICWMTALLLHTRGVSTLQPVYPAAGPTAGRRWGTVAPEMVLLDAGRALYQAYALRNEAVHDTALWLDEAAENLWRVLRANCEPLIGASFLEVQETNLKKLADRAARGVLKGSGDHR